MHDMEEAEVQEVQILEVYKEIEESFRKHTHWSVEDRS
jgi:hypothetical protein